MQPLLVLIGSLFLCGTALAVQVPVLVYHDIRDQPGADEYVVSTQAFREQMAFLKQQGYQPVSLARYADAAAGKSKLPEKPIVLSFDDGLVSFRDIAVPVLAEYSFPAVLSVVTGWVDGNQVPDDYRGRLLTWEQLRSLSRSPLVEVLSHTDNLHHGVLANPQGNLTPATITRRYDVQARRYESETDYRKRIRADLTHSAQRLLTELGKSPPGIAWPYGDYNQVLAEEAAALGFKYQLTLDKEPARTEQFPRINRVALRAVRTIAAFESTLSFERAHQPLRILEIELDAMANSRAADQEQWLSALLGRARLSRANVALVNPFTRDGAEAFFQNGSVPVRAEVLHRVLHQLRTRAGIDYLLLRITAVPAVTEAAAELARRHPYDGVLLAANISKADAAILQKQFSYHHPGTQCGQEQGAAWPVCQDFMLVSVDSLAPAHYSAMDDKTALPVYYLLQNRPDADGRQVATALHDMRVRGARNYGLHDGPFLENPEYLRRVATELAAHSPPGTRY
jgi:peptidoglycan/xylan/chitin deacetylase (PgdA/CDA1 family)